VTIPACDGQTDRQTDGIAVASTALAMRALRRAVKKVEERRKKDKTTGQKSIVRIWYAGRPS